MFCTYEKYYSPIGKRYASDIFGKANANQCYVMVPEFVDVYCTGEICGASKHYWGEVCTDPIKATPGYTITTIQYNTFDMCTSGGASGSPSSSGNNGSGTVNTGPYTGRWVRIIRRPL